MSGPAWIDELFDDQLEVETDVPPKRLAGEPMQTEIAKKQSRKTPNEFLVACRIERMIEGLSQREQLWIIKWLADKFGPKPVTAFTSSGPDRISRPNPIE